MWQGLNRYEFRRRYLTGHRTTWYVYFTAPTSRLSAVIDLDEAITDTPRQRSLEVRQWVHHRLDLGRGLLSWRASGRLCPAYVGSFLVVFVEVFAPRVDFLVVVIERSDSPTTKSRSDLLDVVPLLTCKRQCHVVLKASIHGLLASNPCSPGFLTTPGERTPLHRRRSEPPCIGTTQNLRHGHLSASRAHDSVAVQLVDGRSVS